MVARRTWPWLLVVLATPAAARAQEFRPIVDRDYAIDLHQGAALGDGRTVGMGGTGVATAAGSAGSLFNPAAAAVRPETSRGNWDWDWHFDYLSTAVGTDFDNNGQPQETDFDLFEGPLVTAGVVGQYRSWGLGLSFLYLQHPIEEDGEVTLRPNVVIGRLTIARSFLADALTLGIAFRTGQFQFSRVSRVDDVEATTELFSIGGSALEAGALWRPPDRDIRIGGTAALPVRGDKVAVAECDPLDCAGDEPGEGYILPERAVLPWQVSVGAAWRRGPTRWNRRVRADWRDEKSVVLTADLVVTGHVASGHGVQAFAARQLQPSGRNVGISPRFGAEYEWVPGRFRIRGGSYWEPSRFRDPAGQTIQGRLHVTLGLDVRVWSFRLWNESYRVRLTLTSDGARQYGNGGLSIGFWH